MESQFGPRPDEEIERLDEEPPRQPDVRPSAEHDAKLLEVVRATTTILRGKWTVSILLVLRGGSMRYGEILRSVRRLQEAVQPRQAPPLQEAALTRSLQAMRSNGLVTRHVYSRQFSPHVEYQLTYLGANLLARIGSLWVV